MTNTERFKEIITQIPFEHNDLSVVNREENLPLFKNYLRFIKPQHLQKGIQLAHSFKVTGI
jgi:hypothetical protein